MILIVTILVLEIVSVLVGCFILAASTLAFLRKPQSVRFVLLVALLGLCICLYGVIGLLLRYYDIPIDIASRLGRYSPSLLGIALGISLSLMVFDSMRRLNISQK